MMYSLSFLCNGFCSFVKWSADKDALLALASRPHRGYDLYLNTYENARFISSEKI